MCYCRASNNAIADVNARGRIWAIPALHANIDALINIHDQLLEHFEAGDKIIYLGNYTGYGAAPIGTLNEILTFRRLILSFNGVFPNDIVYLRGAQEEIFEKLWQLHYAPDAEKVLLWMLGNGLSPTLQALDIDPHDVINAVRYGSNYMSQWINKPRRMIRSKVVYDDFFIHMKRAATSTHAIANEEDGSTRDYRLLFVNAGLKADKTLTEQADAFWWQGDHFDSLKDPYSDFDVVIRGYDPKHRGIYVRKHFATLDNGNGFGGDLICAAIGHKGDILHYLEAVQ